MKKLLLVIFSLLFLSTAMAQDKDPWLGTWTSESYTDMETVYKLVIRITKNGDQYNVRTKTIKVNDPNYSLYHRPYTVTRLAENSMWLESYLKKSPFTVDYGNGSFIESYSDITYYYKLTLSNGVLHYSFYKYHTIKYDRNMRRTGEYTEKAANWTEHELDLFNDDW